MNVIAIQTDIKFCGLVVTVVTPSLKEIELIASERKPWPDKMSYNIYL